MRMRYGGGRIRKTSYGHRAAWPLGRSGLAEMALGRAWVGVGQRRTGEGGGGFMIIDDTTRYSLVVVAALTWFHASRKRWRHP